MSSSDVSSPDLHGCLQVGDAGLDDELVELVAALVGQSREACLEGPEVERLERWWCICRGGLGRSWKRDRHH